MARAKIGLAGQVMIESKPKKTRQGFGKNTKYAATSRNNAKKRYRGQGNHLPFLFARITMTEPTSDFLDNLAAKQHEKMLREVAGDHKNTDKDDEPQLLEE